MTGHVLKNFSVSDFIFTENDGPITDSIFDHWMNGSEPEIDVDLISFLWGAFDPAIIHFFREGQRNPFEDERLILDSATFP